MRRLLPCPRAHRGISLIPFTCALSFSAGNLRARLFRDGVKLSDVSSPVTIANVVNGIPLQKPTVGTSSTLYAEANLLCETFGVYSRDLADNNLITTNLMSIAVRQGRGR